MDDANLPGSDRLPFLTLHLLDLFLLLGLLSLPYYGFVDKSDPTYINTRNFVLSDFNAYYSNGTAGNSRLCARV